MDLEFNETERLIQQTARTFAQKALAPGAGERDRAGVFPADIIRQLSELGLMTITVPENWGGAGAGTVAYALAMMEISRACASTAVTMAVTNMVAEIICAFGTEEQREKHVTAIAEGRYPAGAFALTEPHCGSDAAALKTTARRSDRGWVLNGTKQFITSGDQAGVMVVWARTGGEGAGGISAFLVEKDTPGLTVGPPEKKMGLRSSTTVSLTFEDAFIPESALLGQLHRGFPVAMAALDGGRIGVGAQAVGIGLAALDEAVKYAQERKSFGKMLSEHQAIQWLIADSATELEAARLLVLQAAALKNAGKPFTRQASMAKLYASEAANRACARALQVHGGYGYIQEYTVERLYRDVRVTTIYEGTSEVQRLVIARSFFKDR